MRVLRIYFIIFWGKLDIFFGHHSLTHYNYLLADWNISPSSNEFVFYYYLYNIKFVGPLAS
jgi:hypothetical protein